MNELQETAKHYREHPEALAKLTPDELQTLKNTLGDVFAQIFEPVEKIRKKKQKTNKGFREYRKEVNRLTTLNLQILPNLRAKSILDAQMYVIDHKIPAIIGFKMGISAGLIASSGNLQVITVAENFAKGTRPLVDAENSHIWQKIS